MTETNMRDLDDFTDNELTIRDAKTGGECTLFYRDIETEDLVEYRSISYKKQGGGKVKINITKAQLHMALKIITGFKKGYFSLKGNAISSDIKDPEYYKEWKSLLKRKAPELLVVLALQVFEGNAVKGNAADFVPEFEESEEDALLGDQEIAGDGSGQSLTKTDEEELPLETSFGE